MAFRDAATIKIISDAIVPSSDSTLNNAVGTDIDLAISAAAAKTGINRTEKTTVDLEAVINGRESPVEIVQSGGNLMLEDILTKMKASGFRVEARPKKSYSAAKDRVTLTIAWNTV